MDAVPTTLRSSSSCIEGEIGFEAHVLKGSEVCVGLWASQLAMNMGLPLRSVNNVMARVNEETRREPTGLSDGVGEGWR